MLDKFDFLKLTFIYHLVLKAFKATPLYYYINKVLELFRYNSRNEIIRVS